MREIKNLPQFLALIERYETITIEEIEELWIKSSSSYVQNKLTGFGLADTCTLCLGVKLDWKDDDAAKKYCIKCVWGNIKDGHFTLYGCTQGEQSKTYNKIENAITPKMLLAAYRNRAKRMRQFLIDNDIK
jgi:hypothetical protein